MFFKKCFPTSTSAPSLEMDERNKAPGELTALPFATMFVESEPYKYIHEGNVEKLLEALQKRQFNPREAWLLAMKYSSSPALYLFAIEKLPREDLEARIVAALKDKKIIKELPPIMAAVYSVLAKHSYADVSAYDQKVMNAMVEKSSLFWLAINGRDGKVKDEWSNLFDTIQDQRTELRSLHQPVSKSCFSTCK